MSFDLCDSVTRFQVLAAAHTLDGRLGAAEAPIEARLPFSVEPKLPIEVTASDKIDVPVTRRQQHRRRRAVTVDAPSPQDLHADQADEAEDARRWRRNSGPARCFRFQPTIVEGEAALRLRRHAASRSRADAVARTVPRRARRLPRRRLASATCSKASPEHEITLPETWVKGTLKCQVQVYPSTLADLQKGLEGLLREPSGCFEQTSTSNYPNVLILDYLKESDQAKPGGRTPRPRPAGPRLPEADLVRVPEPGQATQREGYEWFGGTAPPHEALTAYGLLQFRDMARVQRRGPGHARADAGVPAGPPRRQGRLPAQPAALDTFGRAPDDITNAYIVWALTESGKDDDVTKELNALAEQAKTSKDPYFLALVANSLHQPRPGRTRRVALLQDGGRLPEGRRPSRRRARRASPAPAAATCRSRRRPWPCSAG